ncbi:MAG: 50S ribosomal protein L21 [Elusimicrobiota bacterium]
MYAIIETGGKQYWVVPGEVIQVERLDAEKGKEIIFKALWAAGDAASEKDAPVSRQASVTAEVDGHTRGPKIIVFKRRAKKAYKRTHGHRQELTKLRIKSIALN